MTLAAHLAGCEACRAKLAARTDEGARYLGSREAASLARRLAGKHPGFASGKAVRRLMSAWVLAGAGGLAAIGLAWALIPRDTRGEEHVVLRFEQAWMDAIRNKDAVALDQILADDYIYTDGQGSSTKADSLRAARSGAGRLSLFQPEEMKVRLFGDTAIVTGRARIKGLTAQGKAYDTRIQFTDTIARIGGRWRAVAAHVSGPPPP